MNAGHIRGMTAGICRTSSQASVVRHPPSWRFLGLSLLSAFCVSVNGHAQSARVPAGTTPLSRLAVRPHAMTLGAATTTAGVQKLDSFPGYLVYVPKHCVGTRRVPLVVFLHGGDANGQWVVDEQREMADKYGMIVLAPTAAVAPGWDVVYHEDNTGAGAPDEIPRPLVSRDVTSSFQDVQNMGRALAYVLKNFAIDPDKIAIGGFSDGATDALFLGRNNEDVFSQVVVMSPFDRFDGSLGPRNKQTRFLIAGGTSEFPGPYVLSLARNIRSEGHEVEAILSTRGHIFIPEEKEYAWNWLAQGWQWEAPSAVKALRPRSLPDNDPLWTADVLTTMITFWKAFKAEPDSIRTAALKAHQEYGTMMVGQERAIVVKTDLAAIVAAYPSVAADLKNAGLTVQQEEEYRIAILRAHFLHVAKSPIENPTVVQNHDFYKSHLKEFTELWFHTSIWATE